MIFVKKITVHKMFTTFHPVKFREIYSKMREIVV